MTRVCGRCGTTFETHRTYHRLCWSCWRAERDDELRGDAYDRGFAAGAAAGASVGRSSPPQADLLRDAVTLCQPDRHPPGRHELANRVTAELLALLEQVRSTAA